MVVKQLAPKQSQTELAQELGLSRSALYYQPKLPTKDLKLKASIEQVMKQHKAYGHKRVAIALNINKKRAWRVMKLFNLKPKRSRKAPFKPNDLDQAPMAIPNLISGTIIEALNQVWVSDFTYLPYFGRFLYLATVEDLFTRQLLGFSFSFQHDAKLASQALLNALEQNTPPNIIHSDQGSEYRSQAYLNLLTSLNIQPSMSQKSSPWQNGYQESFYSEFKLELGHPECYPTVGELIEAINRQINYYNHERIHTALKCSPTVFAQRAGYQQFKAVMQVKTPLTTIQVINQSNLINLTNLIYQPIAEGQVV